MGIEILIYISMFLLGVCVGSFANVCILRMPVRQSIIPASHCPECGKELKWYELIPLFSYIALKGRCRSCKVKISFQYPLIEGMNGILWLLVCYVMDLHGKIEAVVYVVELSDIFEFSIYSMISLLSLPLLFCFTSTILLIITVIDIRTMEIPPALNISILIIGILRLALDYQNWYVYLIGAVCVSGVLLILWLITNGRALGGGDIKLMAVSGLLLGWKLIIIAFLLGCVIGSVVHLTRMAITKAGRTLAFGPYLAAGIVISMLWGEKILNWYLQLFNTAI